MIAEAIAETIIPLIEKVIDDRPVNLQVVHRELIDEVELRRRLSSNDKPCGRGTIYNMEKKGVLKPLYFGEGKRPKKMYAWPEVIDQLKDYNETIRG